MWGALMRGWNTTCGIMTASTTATVVTRTKQIVSLLLLLLKLMLIRSNKWWCWWQTQHRGNIGNGSSCATAARAVRLLQRSLLVLSWRLELMCVVAVHIMSEIRIRHCRCVLVFDFFCRCYKFDLFCLLLMLLRECGR